MIKTAQIILTGYDTSKIQKSISLINRFSKKNNIKLDWDPPKNEQIKSNLWGCQNVPQKVIDVTGEKRNLQKIIHLKIIDGVYLELILK